MLAQTRPDLAIVDLMMEYKDSGFALCYHIKKKDPSIPVILVTAVTSETGLEFDAATEEERSWVKADAMLAKPLRFEQLLCGNSAIVKGTAMTQTLRILVVDDEPGMQQGIARALRDFKLPCPICRWKSASR